MDRTPPRITAPVTAATAAQVVRGCQPNSELAYWMSVVESNARRLDIPFVDFVSVFAELPAAEVGRLFVDGYHFSEEGNALVARKLLERLLPPDRTPMDFRIAHEVAQLGGCSKHPLDPLPQCHVIAAGLVEIRDQLFRRTLLRRLDKDFAIVHRGSGSGKVWVCLHGGECAVLAISAPLPFG